MLPNPALVHASMRALVSGHYLRAEDGAVGRIDPGKIDAMGGFLFDVEILRGADGTLLKERPAFAEWFDNGYLDE